MRRGLLLVLLVAASVAWADEEEPDREGFVVVPRDPQNLAVGPLSVTVDMPNHGPSWGYTPLRLELVNRSSRSTEVELIYAARASAGRKTVTRTVEVHAGERRPLTLPIPVGLSAGQLTVRSDLLERPAVVPLYARQISSLDRTVLAIAAGGAARRESPGSSWLDELGASERPKKSVVPPGNARNHATIYVHALDPADAPEELAAYVGFDAVVLPELPLAELSEGVRRALEAYAASGGRLVLPSAGRADEVFLPLLDGTDGGERAYGLGELALGADGSRWLTNLGVSERAPVVEPKAPSPRRSVRHRLTAIGYTDAEDRVSLLPSTRAPVGRFLVIIALFTLALGPGSVYVARRRGPPALLVSVPLTAFVTCLAIVGYALVKDGLSVHAATRSFTLLDSARHRAVTVGLGAFYANLSPGRPVFPGASTVVLAERSGRVQVGMDWTEGTRLAGDFIPSRTYREWGFVTVDPSRARLLVRQAPGGFEVQNALGADIERVHFQVGGVFYEVNELKEGASARAQRIGRSHRLLNDDFSGGSRFRTTLRSRMLESAGDGQFVAHVRGRGFLPLTALRWRDEGSVHIVRGRFQ